jgi:type I restriction enzyme S subunit
MDNDGYIKVKLGDVVSFRTGKLNSNAATPKGIYPFFTCSQEVFRTDTYSFDTECVILGGNNANGIYPLKYFKGKFDAYQRTYVICSKNNQILSNRYLYYYLTKKLEKLKNISTGAATKFLTLKILNELEVELPSIAQQNKIVSILSSYDILIQNNTLYVQLLKEMAQLIYREWFVHFRFPGYENVKMVDSSMGKIPEGWEVKHVGDISKIYRGKSYKSGELCEDGGLPFINLKCIGRGGGFRIDGIKRYNGKYKDSQMVKTNDIVIAVTDMTQERRLVAHVARIPGIINNKAVISMDLVKIEPIAYIKKEYFYGMLRFSDFSNRVKNYANGANVLHLNPEKIEDFEFVLPPKDLRDKYSEIFYHICSLSDNLNLKNAILGKTRDLLLPKLVSGEINVSNLS